MIRTDKDKATAYLSQFMFSFIENDIRYQVAWRQYIYADGKLIGIGGFKPLKISRRQAQILKLREDYLKRTRKNVP